MRIEHLETGRIGEKLAAEFLQRKGYKIIEQNYRNRYAEIDLIAREKDVLVIVEVRTKIGEQFGTPEDTLNNKKLQKVKRNAIAYAAYLKWNKLYRIDAVCVVLRKDQTVERINHYINI